MLWRQSGSHCCLWCLINFFAVKTHKWHKDVEFREVQPDRVCRHWAINSLHALADVFENSTLTEEGSISPQHLEAKWPLNRLRTHPHYGWTCEVSISSSFYNDNSNRDRAEICLEHFYSRLNPILWKYYLKPKKRNVWENEYNESVRHQ